MSNVKSLFVKLKDMIFKKDAYPVQESFFTGRSFEDELKAKDNVSNIKYKLEDSNSSSDQEVSKL